MPRQQLFSLHGPAIEQEAAFPPARLRGPGAASADVFPAWACA